MDDFGSIPDDLDLFKPSVARIYDYLLGGHHHFAVDRELAEQMSAAMPDGRTLVRINRAFLRRAVAYCVRAGVRQFLDLGCGLPTTGAVHEIAQAVDPRCRVVYVDNEPVVVAHSEMILRGNEQAAIVRSDVRDCDRVLLDERTQRLLDPEQPTAVMMLGLLHFIPDADDPAGLVGRYLDAVAPGSYLVLSHGSPDTAHGIDRAVTLSNQSQSPGTLRPRAQIEAMFAGSELVEPGLVPMQLWHPESPDDAHDAPSCSFLGGVGRKPD